MPGIDADLLADAVGPPRTGDINHLGLLYRYTDRLYRATSLEEIYDAAMEAICEGLETDRASILRFDKQGVMRFVAHQGLSERYRQAVDGHSPWQVGQRDAEIICISDIASSGESPELIATVVGEGIRGLCFIPLAPDNQVIGKFMVYYGECRGLDSEHQELALVIARQLGFALQTWSSNRAAQYLAALVDSSDDAIISKSLDGIIESWNGGAARLFGYSAEEAIGRSIAMLVPDDRLAEEDEILATLQAGGRLQSFETVRKRKDGALVDLSLTISPIIDNHGRVIGVSKIARDISEKLKAAEAQALLLAEMNHRVKNAYALTGSLIHLSAASATDPASLAETVVDRLAALSRAHTLTLPTQQPVPAGVDQRPTSLKGILAAILAPFERDGSEGGTRVAIDGDDEPVGDRLLTSIALTFHELATNAAKYGSLSVADGSVSVTIRSTPEAISIVWKEAGGPTVERPDYQGFGSKLLGLAIRQLGEIDRSWSPDGLIAAIRINRPSTS